MNNIQKGASFDGVPPYLYPTLHYYPHGVSSEVGNIRNPLTIIKLKCKPEDVVIFKLDIDSPKIEQEIMEQVSLPSSSSLSIHPPASITFPPSFTMLSLLSHVVSLISAY